MSEIRESDATNRRRAVKAQRARALRIKMICFGILAFLIVVVTLSFVMCRNTDKRKRSAVETTVKSSIEIETVAPTEKKAETTRIIYYETTKLPKEAKYKVTKPKKRSIEEISKILAQYAKKDARFNELYNNRGNYSKSELNKAINNPEMADFILSYRTAKKKAKGGISEAEKASDFPLFLQWDKRWGYVKYGDSNIGFAGCGPTCLSMVIYSLTRNENCTPDSIAKFSENNGYYVNNVGTSWSLFKEGAENFNLKVSSLAVSEKDMIKALDNGKMIILAIGPGDFTTGGHFIVVYGHDNSGFMVNDPYCKARSEITYSFARLKNQIKTMWVYSYD